MNVGLKRHVGSSIRAYRESKGLSLREFARELNMPYTSIDKMENGLQKIDSVTLLKMADFFGVPLDRLLNRQFQNKVMEEDTTLMELSLKENFQYILENYLTAKTEPFKGHKMGEYIREKTKNSIIKDAILDEDMYLVTGSVGQGQWAEIAWISVYLRDITTSATRGYYIVFLIDAKMGGVYISLNQGWTYFKNKYNTKLGKEKIKTVAKTIRKKLNTVPERLMLEEIDLQGTGYLSQGYESGHICGRFYSADSLPSSKEIVQDLHDLLTVYKEVHGLLGGRTIEQFNDYLLSEDDKQYLEVEEVEEKYQDSVSDLLKNDTLLEDEENHEQSEPRPEPVIDKGGKQRWPRDAKVAAKALSLSKYTCAYNKDDALFISKSTGKPYLECHHLIPMKMQSQFEFKLDKVANIVCLSPSSHRLIHHGTDKERKKMLKKLYDEREIQLQSIGIEITFEELRKAYDIND